MRDIASIYALMATPGVGYVAAGNAVRAVTAASMGIEDLAGRSIEEIAERLPREFAGAADPISRCDASQIDRFERMLERLYSAGGQALLITDQDYPARIRDALGRNAPPILCVVGDIALLSADLAGIVGARDASPESGAYAGDCARHFTRRGIGVVSGAAKGIDEIAHRTTLESGGSSVFVLPHGILRYRGAGTVREALEDGRAMLVSEFVPDAAWATHAAIVRNATIAAAARIVCVFEPRKTGGSIRTAEAALAQSKPVLIHCSARDAQTERRLVSSGARTLPVHVERAMQQLLDDAWAAEPAYGKAQQELFNRPEG